MRIIGLASWLIAAALQRVPTAAETAETDWVGRG